MKEKLKRLLCHPAVILFCGFVLIFSFADSRVNNRERSELENRELAQKPEMTRSNLLASEDKKKFSYLYETYVNDQFLERDRWISLKSRTEALLLKTENNGIIYGKDGTMYQKFYTVNENWFQKNTEALAQFMSRHPGLVTAMIVPSADRISSKTPPAPFVDEAPYFERMKAAFSKDGQWIDLTQEFCDKTEELYYHTDHHWTTSAAYLAYLDYMKAIGRTPAFVPAQHPCATAEGFFGTLYSKSKLYHATADTLDYYPDLTARMILKQGATKQDEEIAAAAGLKDEIVDLYDESKLDTRDKYAMFLHGNNAFSRIEGRGEGKILVIKDSYANCFVPFLTEDYAQVDVIDLRSFKASVDRVMEENVYDNVLILYNFQSYHEDQNIVKLNFYNKA